MVKSDDCTNYYAGVWSFLFIFFFIMFLIIIPWSYPSTPKNQLIIKDDVIDNVRGVNILPNGNYTTPDKCNNSNIVIPAVNNSSVLINFEIDAKRVHIGDYFTVDCSNNPLNQFKIIYTGFDNNQSTDKVDEIIVNNGQNIYNTVLIQISVGKTVDGKNILITSSPLSGN